MFPLIFLQASVASLLAGACAWLLLRAAARTWPALQAHRAPWLLAVAAVAASLALGLLPASLRPSIVPALELPAVLSPSAHAGGGIGSNAAALAAAGRGAAPGDMSGDAGDDGAMPIQPAPTLLWLGYVWLAIYGAGLAATAARWLHGRRQLDTLLAAAQRLDRFDLAAHPGCASLQRQLPPVREIDAPIAPMLVGLRHPILLLPRHLRDFDPAQQRLVVEHELTHLARRDHLWMHLSFLLQAVQWFNPMVARLGKQMAWAQELGCDRTVLAGRPSAQRRAYAAALVAQMRMQAVPGHGAALAFGGRAVDAVAARIGMIRDGVPAIPRAVSAILGWAALPTVLAASVLLQPALAWHLPSQAVAEPAAGAAERDGMATTSSVLAGPAAQGTAAASAPPWLVPMQRLRVSAFFGVQHTPTGRRHGGMDFAAPTGTPIVAPAAGTIVASTGNYMGESKWGNVVAIEHANGLRSTYAHMDKRQVKEGERVSAGQQIGTSGASGKVTGPHLHLEVTRNGERIDPQALLGNLEANATHTALQRLKASRSN